MSTLSLNGARATSGTITIPMYGTWSADITMALAAEVGMAVTLVVGDLTLVGTVVRQASFAGSTTVRIVGGAGGWREELPSRGYSHIIGVKLSTILEDAAREAGESISVSSDRVIGKLYGRERAKGERVLNLLLDGLWWIDNEGVTQTSSRDASAIVTPFTVVSWNGARGQFEIATEAISAWQPGRTFTTNTVPTAQTISSVTIEADNEGKVRLHVLNSDGGAERLRTDLRSVIRAESPSLSYAGVWEYSVAPSVGLGLVSTIDCAPTDPRMPSLTRVPLVGMGVVAAPVAGTSCRIQFVNCDPTRPECVSLGSTTEHLMTVESFTVIMHNLIVLMAAFATPPAWLASGVTPTMINTALATTAIPSPPGLVAQLANAATQASAMASGPGSTSTLYTAAIAAAMTGKTLDVSGLFPSVGIPNGD